MDYLGLVISKRHKPVHGQTKKIKIPDWSDYFNKVDIGKSYFVQEYNSLFVKGPQIDNMIECDLYMINEEVVMAKNNHFFPANFILNLLGLIPLQYSLTFFWGIFLKNTTDTKYFKDVYFKGACEIEHFEFLCSVGFKKYIIDNCPSSYSFTSMKIIQSVLLKNDIHDFYFTDVPESIDEFDYYKNHLAKLGFGLKFIEDLSGIIEVSSFFELKNILNTNTGKKIIFQANKYFIDSRDLNYELLQFELP